MLEMFAHDSLYYGCCESEYYVGMWWMIMLFEMFCRVMHTWESKPRWLVLEVTLAHGKVKRTCGTLKIHVKMGIMV